MKDATVNGWTVETLRIHMAEMREEREKFEAERDRRYAEVNVEREKALKIKEEADKVALTLASEIQKYKDEKANELRSQINSERGLYATHAELGAAVDKINETLKPVLAFMISQQGLAGGKESMTKLFVQTLPALVLALIAIGSTVIAIAFAIRKG